MFKAKCNWCIIVKSLYKYQTSFCCQVFRGLSRLKSADVCTGKSFKKSVEETSCEIKQNYADPLKYRIVCIDFYLLLSD